MRDFYDVLIKPVITEKTSELMSENKYTFKVDKRANKFEIKQAVEHIFKVDVTHVRTMNVPGKLKRQGRTSGMTSEWKKAIVTIGEGQRIPIFDE
jgi:large subunit ribosomal protein L23